ncbi:TrbM/KikA/MpfK family conjugal transfer protein [Candidatus Hamiltonella endosymbiont of Tuberolachnus salignus]|uniref:TrbM/KikA/MpfK family conjugal transfer protein n=1 Tax=Candidatus Williamhamiltonella endosymbiont of Tuberolachnus salignus TaxID=3077954 RepID=UPI0030CD07F4
MKKTVTAAACLCLSVIPAVFADERIEAHDPCTVFLCMAGKVEGANPSECSGAVRTFFSLNAFKKFRFNPLKTLDLRKQFLGHCASADPAYVSKILSQFGRLRG